MVIIRSFCRAMRVAVVGLAILAAISISAPGQEQPCDVAHVLGKKIAARDVLNKGVQAFRKARYDDAICYFQSATRLDPGLVIAKMYLGTAMAETVVPGLETPENLKIAQQAIDIFQEVLDKKPHDINTIKQIAALDYSIKRFEEAKGWQKKVLEEDPKDPEAAYTIGAIDWMEAHMNMLEELTPAGLTDDGEGNANAPAEVMEKIKAKNSVLVEEGIQYLNRAVSIRPNYDDAMVYMNLIYRCKASVDWGNETERAADVAAAAEWVRKAIDVRKELEKRKSGEVSEKP